MTGEWPDDIFSSAEIEELTYRFQKAVEETDKPIKVELFFTPEKARQFIESTNKATYHPLFAQQVLAFAVYVAGVVKGKLEGGAND